MYHGSWPLSLLLALVLAAGAGAAEPPKEPPYRPSPENLQAREWFQDARFGLFIHWGVYSVLGKGEWVLNNDKMSLAEYEKLPARFNPTKYDPDAWVAAAKGAGMKYITITSKHHDGFAMWDSKVTDWDVVDRTPYKKDVLKMLADACARADMKLFFYHSHLDWHHPDYFPRGKTGGHTGRPDKGDFNRYLDFMDAQLTELLGGQYGPVAGIWFDGWWDQQVQGDKNDPRKTRVDWRLRRTYDLIHRLRPAALVGNNHHVAPFPGEDFQMFEKDLPGGNTAGFNADSKPGALPLETCETIANSWGYNKDDHKYKSTKDLIQYLVRAAGNNANFLLNVGPRPDGTLQPEFLERLKEIGAWMNTHGETIYATRGGPFAPAAWGVSTRSKTGDRVYVHVLDPKAEVRLPGAAGKYASAFRLHGRDVPVRTVGQDLVIELPAKDRDPIDTVIVLEKK